MSKPFARFLLCCAFLSLPACDSANETATDDDPGDGSGATGDFRECPTSPISVGQTVTGEISPEDCELPAGDPADYYRFNVASSGTFTITVDATGDQTVDPVLTLYFDRGTVLATINDGGAGDNEVLSIELSRGDYVIETTSADLTTGSYQLRLE